MSLTFAQAARSLQSPGTGFSSVELEQFARDGFVVSHGLADPEMRQGLLAATRAALASGAGPVEYEADLHYPGAPVSRSVAGGDTIRRLKEVYGRDPAFDRWVLHRPLNDRLQQLLGPAVVMPRAHHNCVMTKQPRFSSQTGWHQDIRYWSFRRPELVSVWLALGRETPENGCLNLIPGTHRMEFDRDRLDGELFLRPELPENAALIARQVPAPLEPGDALFFHCRTFHAAGRNTTAETKFSAVFTFRAEDNPPLPGTRSATMPELALPRADLRSAPPTIGLAGARGEK
ncbi:MAG: phytanoyl-CoA dioxygenase family protein [Planctomycetaceae bacterium]